VKNPMVKDKLTEIVHLVESVFAGAVGSSALATKLPSGNWLVDPLLANTVKQNVTRFVYQVARLTHDLGGGLLSTLPSDADFRNEEIGGSWRNISREGRVLDGGQAEAVPLHREHDLRGDAGRGAPRGGFPAGAADRDAAPGGPPGQGGGGEEGDRDQGTGSEEKGRSLTTRRGGGTWVEGHDVGKGLALGMALLLCAADLAMAAEKIVIGGCTR